MNIRRAGRASVVVVVAAAAVGVGGTGMAQASTVASATSATAAVSTATSLQWPLLRRGSTGEPVRSLQYLLRAHGSGISVDGDFGPATEGAVRAFQSRAGLVVDGLVGSQTWSALLVTVRLGSRGDAVRAVQDQFQFRNLSGDPSKGLQVDGIFGPKTDSTVRAFQHAVGLTSDGIVGPQTWNALIRGALSF